MILAFLVISAFLIFLLYLLFKYCRVFCQQTIYDEIGIIGSQAKICIFCEIAVDLNNVLYFNNDLFVKFDINPESNFHLLVISRRHIQNISRLKECDFYLIKEMVEIGEKMIKENKLIENCIFAFHKPIFTSVPHLHLHIIGLPFYSNLGKLKFSKCSTVDPYELLQKWNP